MCHTYYHGFVSPWNSVTLRQGFHLPMLTSTFQASVDKLLHELQSPGHNGIQKIYIPFPASEQRIYGDRDWKFIFLIVIFGQSEKGSMLI